MDGTEKLFQTFFHIPFVEGTWGSGILHIGLCLFQGFVDGLAVVEASGKVDDFGTDEDISTVDRLFELDAVQWGTTAKCYVCLSSGKYTAGEVDDYTAEGQSLAFMNSDGPC